MKKLPFRRRLGRAFRLAWQEIAGPDHRSAFDGAGIHRLLLDWIAQARSADEEIRGDIRMLRARARESPCASRRPGTCDKPACFQVPRARKVAACEAIPGVTCRCVLRCRTRPTSLGRV